MKNKTKKILAGACLGLMGLGVMTGCSLTEDQEKTLNDLITKADNLIEATEAGNNYVTAEQLKEILEDVTTKVEILEDDKQTKEDLFMLYEYARTSLMVNQNNVWNNLRIKTTSSTTENVAGVYKAEAEAHFFKRANNTRVVYTKYKTFSKESGESESGFGRYRDDATLYPNKNYIQDGYLSTAYSFSTTGMALEGLTADHMVSYNINDKDNYVLTFIANVEISRGETWDPGVMPIENTPVIIVCEISKDGKLISIKNTTIIEERGMQEFCFNVEYLYNDLTEAEVTANINKINE